jgi:hypothetical protein
MGKIMKLRRATLAAIAQLFNRYPVLNIRPTIAKQNAKNPSVIARLIPTLTSEDS